MQKESPSNQIPVQRLLNFHKNKTKFTYKDQPYNFHLDHDKINISPDEDYMMGLWRLFDCIYFKECGEEELSILNYLHSLSQSTPTMAFHQQEKKKKEFEKMIRETYSEEYINSRRHKNQYQAWMKEMYAKWNRQVPQQDIYHSKDIQNQMSQLREQQINNLSMLKNIYQQMQKELDDSNAQLFHHQQVGQFDQIKPTLASTKASIQRGQILQYLKYQINHLQKKQIAQSISKLVSKRMVKGNCSEQYELAFEEGMGVGNLWMTQRQLDELNQLRDPSLYQFYAVGWKSKFNYICHNYYGFEMLAKRTNSKIISQSPSNVKLGLSRAKPRGLFGFVSESFGGLESCHDCKLLYNKNILFKCNYASSKPKHSIASFHDPYILNMIKSDTKSNNLGTSMRQGWRIINPVLQYSFKDGEYTCGRYFCKMCVKKDESQLKCKFCQRTCICSRCLRSNTIDKLSTMFIMLGGNPQFLREQSYFSLFQNKHKIDKDKNHRSHQSGLSLSDKTLTSYKMQLEQLRLISHMVMEREAIKQEQFHNEEEIFESILKTAHDDYI